MAVDFVIIILMKRTFATDETGSAAISVHIQSKIIHAKSSVYRLIGK